MTVELLRFGGCPSWHGAWSDLGLALQEARIDAEVRLRDVTGPSLSLLRARLLAARGGPRP